MEKTKKTNSLGFGYIIASFVFLFNPNIIVFDILPDFIGFFLLGMGLVKLADIMPRFADVRESFIKLGWISLAKFLSIFLLYIMPVNEIATFGLVLTFSFAIVDLLFLIPAWNGFFEGMIYLATRKDGHVIFYRKNNHSKSITEKLKSFTILFFIIKETVIIMPELTSLSTYDAIGRVDYYVIDIRYFVNYFRILASIIVIVFGIIWLCRMVSYIRKIKKDVPFVERVLAVYNEEVAPNKDLFLRRRIKAALITLCFAFGFGVDFYVLDINMLPDFLSAALFICGFALLYKYVKRSKIAIAAAALYGVVSLAVWGYTLYFAENFDITHIDKVYTVSGGIQFITDGHAISCNFHTAVTVYRDSGRGISFLSDCSDNGISNDFKITANFRNRFASAGSIRFTENHFLAGENQFVFAFFQFHRSGEELEQNAFFFCFMDLDFFRRYFGFATAVDTAD